MPAHLGVDLIFRTPVAHSMLIVSCSLTQWVGTPPLVSAVSNAGALGMLTALTQPNPEALREAVKKTKSMLRPGVWERSRYGGFGVNITLLPSITVRTGAEESLDVWLTCASARSHIASRLRGLRQGSAVGGRTHL